MLYEGININITLLFSIESYEVVARAYQNALERRISEGKDIKHVASVASFFLSRIDILTDKILKEKIIPSLTGSKKTLAENLLGETAIASAKIAYSKYKEIFSGEQWAKLTLNGAKAQRLLWASTSNKTEGYRDTRYVEPLIGVNTVNTMPEVTIDAFNDHGKLIKDTIEKDLDHAFNVFLELDQTGVDISEITEQLVEEGIDKFIKPYDQLLQSLEEKLLNVH